MSETMFVEPTSVSEADFAREPHRNRYNVLLNRMGHLAEHMGQAVLVEGRRP